MEGKHTAAYILVSWMIVPAIMLTALYIAQVTIHDIWLLFVTALLIYLFSFMATSIVKKATGRKVFHSKKEGGRKLLVLFVKACLFAAGAVAMIVGVLWPQTGLIEAFGGVQYINLLILSRYGLIYLSIYIMLELVSRIAIGGA